jgi:hypothetical protein
LFNSELVKISYFVRRVSVIPSKDGIQ